jgi:hypothetical protein
MTVFIKCKNIIPVIKLKNMIAGIWHGYTTLENAKPYEELLKHEIFKGIAAKNITGYKKIELT